MIINFSDDKFSKNRSSRFKDVSLPPSKRMLLRFIYKKFKNFTINREAISSLYTYGYGQFRNYFIAMGELFVKNSVIDKKEDIFYLYMDEIKEVIYKNYYKSRNKSINKKNY